MYCVSFEFPVCHIKFWNIQFTSFLWILWEICTLSLSDVVGQLGGRTARRYLGQTHQYWSSKTTSSLVAGYRGQNPSMLHELRHILHQELHDMIKKTILSGHDMLSCRVKCRYDMLSWRHGMSTCDVITYMRKHVMMTCSYHVELPIPSFNEISSVW